MEQGIRLAWEDVYDFVNPFGDHRGGSFQSVWIFDLEKDAIFLTKSDRYCSAPLGLARERSLALDDFELVDSPQQTLPRVQILPGPYWKPQLDLIPRQRSFLSRVLQDFSYTWRHVIRRQMNTVTFTKLAYAIIWISRMDFHLLDCMGFDHISDGEPYVRLVDLPSWETPKVTLIPAGSNWFVLAQHVQNGLNMVRHHMKAQRLPGHPTTNVVVYAILTLRHVVLCKSFGDELLWTKPEKLFDGTPASDTAIDMILWAASTSTTEPQRTMIHHLPIEIQDSILYHHSTASLVASAKLGCELGLGSTFSWLGRGAKIEIVEFKRHRSENSPVESQVIFNGSRSGLSYKRECGYENTHVS